MRLSKTISTMAGLVALIGLSSQAFAQSERDLIETIRAQVQADRTAVVAANMNIGDTQKEDFWALYREYHAEIDTLKDRRVAIIKSIGEKPSMTNDETSEITKEALSLEEDLFKLKKKYVKKFEKVLSPRATLRYFQIENKLDTIVDYGLVQVVPLVN